MITFPPGHEWKNYKDACQQLGEVIKTNQNQRKKQEAYWSEHFLWTKKGRRYMIHRTLKPFIPPAAYNTRTYMNICPQIIHELTLSLNELGRTTFYGLGKECIFPVTEAYILFGLASSVWKEMKMGNAPLDLNTQEQREAYFIYREICHNKLRSAIEHLKKNKLIVQDYVYLVRESYSMADGMHTHTRYARTEEESDLMLISNKLFIELNRRYPDKTKPFHSEADIWLAHKEQEYYSLRKELIKEKFKDQTIAMPMGIREILDFFPATRIAFIPEAIEKAKALLTETELYEHQTVLREKMISWCTVKLDSERAQKIELCLFDIVGGN